MVTKEKLKIYRLYGGFYDGFYVQNKDNILFDLFRDNDDWHIIDELVAELTIVKQGLASKTFEKNLIEKIDKYCSKEEGLYDLLNLIVEEQLNK
jgi:hypothetical protein